MCTSRITNMHRQNASQTKKWLIALGLLYLCFAVYGSLVPLQFRPISMELALERFGAIGYLELGMASRSDWVANILLFIPLAFFWTGAFWSKRSKVLRGVAGVFVFAAGAMLAVGIEFTQLFFPQRTVSINDIAAETLGAALGVALWVASGQRFLAWVESVAAAQGQANVASRLLVAYLVVLFGYAVMPLDLTLSPVEIYRKWNEGRVIFLPFGVAYPDFAHRAYAVLSDVAIWVPAAMLWRISKPSSNGAVFYRVVLSAALIEFFQLFVYSRVTNLMDVLAAAMGAGIGLGLAQRFKVGFSQVHVASRAGWSQSGSSKDALLWCCATLVWLGVLAAVFWYPFDFNTDTGFVQERFIQASHRVLFEALYFGSEYRAYSVVLHKVGFMLPLGLLLGKVGGYLPASVPRPAVFAVVCVLLGVVACGIEVGQLALPGKVGDKTDVLIQFAGGALGYGVYVFATSRIALPGANDVPPPAAGAVHYGAERSGLPSRWAYGVYASGVVLWLFYIGFAGSALAVKLPWLVFWCVASAGLLLAPVSPLAGVMTLMVVGYGISSNGPEYDISLALRLRDGLAFFALVAWLMAKRTAPAQLSVKQPMVLIGAVLLGWLAVCELVALSKGTPWGPFLRLDPSTYFQGAVMFVIAADMLRSKILSLAIALVLVLTFLGRAVLQGVDGVYLESYVATLLIMGLPLAALGFLLAERLPWRLTFAGVAAAMLFYLVASQNRNAAVAVVAVVLAFFLQTPGSFVKKIMVMSLGAASFAAAVVYLLPSGYLNRFRALWDPSASHATAALDRDTASERLEVWGAAWEMSKDYPLTGVGPGNFAHFLQFYRPGRDQMGAHNSYLQMLAETGLPGVVLYVIFFLGVLVLLEKVRQLPYKVGEKAGEIWRAQAARMLQLSVVAYLALGIFNNRNDLVVAYLLAGWAVALSARSAALSSRA